MYVTLFTVLAMELPDVLPVLLAEPVVCKTPQIRHGQKRRRSIELPTDLPSMQPGPMPTPMPTDRVLPVADARDLPESLVFQIVCQDWSIMALTLILVRSKLHTLHPL